MGGFLMNLGAGWLKDNTGSYKIMFLIAGCTYMVALLVIHLLAPKLEEANIE